MSVSVMNEAVTDTVQVVAYGRSMFGSIVIDVVPDPVTPKFFGDPAGHCSKNAFAGAATPSLKVSRMFDAISAADAPPAGDVLCTNGAASAAAVAVSVPPACE